MHDLLGFVLCIFRVIDMEEVEDFVFLPKDLLEGIFVWILRNGDDQEFPAADGLRPSSDVKSCIVADNGADAGFRGVIFRKENGERLLASRLIR